MTEKRLERLASVKRRTGLCASEIYKGMREGTFPEKFSAVQASSRVGCGGHRSVDRCKIGRSQKDRCRLASIKVSGPRAISSKKGRQNRGDEKCVNLPKWRRPRPRCRSGTRPEVVSVLASLKPLSRSPIFCKSLPARSPATPPYAATKAVRHDCAPGPAAAANRARHHKQ